MDRKYVTMLDNAVKGLNTLKVDNADNKWGMLLFCISQISEVEAAILRDIEEEEARAESKKETKTK